MPRILCAIISHAKSNRRSTLRNTWIPLVPKGVDVKFFIGHQEGEIEEDVINLHCNDTHEGIPDKVREICKWAIGRDYAYLWKCDDDVQLLPSKLTEIQHSFTGVVLPESYPKISGFLYGFDMKCMEILSNSDIPKYKNGWDCGYYQDEYWVADKLGHAGILCKLITDCGVIRQPFQKAFPPCWVVAVHGEGVAERSISIFEQLNGFEQPDFSGRLRRKK